MDERLNQPDRDGGDAGKELAEELLQIQPEQPSGSTIRKGRKGTLGLARSAVLGGMYTRYVDRRIAGAEPERKPLDLRLIDRVAGWKLGRTSDTSPVSAEDEHEVLEDLETVYRDVWRWHGTGRYQHRGGQTVDILGEMITDGGVKPHLDRIDPLGDQEMFSTAKARMYARPYADMHHDQQVPLTYRYGKASKWARYFMAPYPIEAAAEAKLWRKEVRRDFAAGATESMKEFQGKFNQTPQTELQQIYDMLDEGSDIQGNYPILIGFAEGAFEDIVKSKALARHESRSGELVPWDKITHLEVPLANVEETRHLLEEAGQIMVPVMPIEMGELYSSKFEFTDLVSGTPLELSKKPTTG
jgi:hypothetical protein